MKQRKISSKKNVIVTGAAKRIGRGIAMHLAKKGWAVTIHFYKSKREAVQLENLIKKQGGKANCIQANLNIEEEIENLITTAKEKFGPSTCLINNAANFKIDSLKSLTKKTWDLNMNINLLAPLLLIQKFEQQLPKNISGNIINIIDQRVWNLTPYFTSYTISKTGLWALTQTLAMVLSPKIRVNAIGPGPTFPSKYQTKKGFERQVHSTILKKRIKTQDICNAIDLLFSNETITGQMIATDSGQHLRWNKSDADFINNKKNSISS